MPENYQTVSLGKSVNREGGELHRETQTKAWSTYDPPPPYIHLFATTAALLGAKHSIQ